MGNGARAMNEGKYLEIIDRDGWRKHFPLRGRIAHVGSAPGNSVALDVKRGSGVSSRHLQFIFPEAGGCRLVNLGDTEVIVNAEEGETKLRPHFTCSIIDGQRLEVGDFTLILHLPVPKNDGVVKHPQPVKGRSIDLRINLPEVQLIPSRPIEGAVIVRNAGDQPGVQFHLTMEGLPADCCEFGPAPLLFPNAEKSVSLRISHPHGPTLTAGKHHLTIRATAPTAYPGERAEITQQIEVAPFYAHKLELERVSYD